MYISALIYKKSQIYIKGLTKENLFITNESCDSMKKIIIDTDIGDDVDDAIAVAYLIRTMKKRNDIDIIGITTVYGDTHKKAEIVSNLLEAENVEDINVYAGESFPLSIDKKTKPEPPCQYTAVDDKFKDAKFGDAVEFIISATNTYNKVTILTLGPLTNIAMAINKGLDIKEGVSLVTMGGMINKAFPEGNIVSDPESAEIVFDSNISKTIIPLDVTLKCNIPSDFIKGMKENGKNAFLCKLIHLWQQKNLLPMIKQRNIIKDEENPERLGIGGHDIAAAIFIINPEIFLVKKGKLVVETAGKYTRGVTVDCYDVFFNKPYGEEFTIAIDIDVDMFYRFFKEIILNA